jgi:long-subunit fatty acid transport protein
MLPPERADSGAQQLGYQLQLNYLYGERNTVALTYNSRRELDQYRLASDPLSSDAWQLSLTGEHWFSPSWALRYDIPTPESSGVVWRQGLRLGVHYRF